MKASSLQTSFTALAGDLRAAIARIVAWITRYGSAVLRQFELMDTFTPNSSDAQVELGACQHGRRTGQRRAVGRQSPQAGACRDATGREARDETAARRRTRARKKRIGIHE